MKIPIELTHQVLLDAGLMVSLAIERDFEEIRSRFEHEGMSFLTITLPTLCDTLDQGLARGRITPSDFLGFRPWRRGGKLPALMSRFFMRVFYTDGSLRERPCIDSIEAMRQVFRLFKKVELPCTSARINQALERYVSNDESISKTDTHRFWYDDLFRTTAGFLWSGLEPLSEELFCSPGKFGSGATAERELYYARHTVKKWPERGESSFPVSYHALSNALDVDSLSEIDFLTPENEPPVRVALVPKTLKTPRIISVEPSWMMLRQQSLALPLMDWLESGRLGFKSIRFCDQSKNRELARSGSVDGRLSTIDLSDASDLVSLDLVKSVFQSCPTVLQMMLDCRSRVAQLPDGKLVKLHKFASMGSAMCFPIESMVFFTIVITEILRFQGRRPSRKSVTAASALVAVYGDDIIVPTEMAACVMDGLEANGLRVNRNKSFHSGLFRESCGGDYYMGNNVTPVYVRDWDFAGARLSASQLSAYISLSNQLYVKGFWNASQSIREAVASRTRFKIPRTTSQVGVLSYSSFCFNTEVRWDESRHAFRVKGPVLVPKRQPDSPGTLRGAMLLSAGARRPDYEPYRSGVFQDLYPGLHLDRLVSSSFTRSWSAFNRRGMRQVRHMSFGVPDLHLGLDNTETSVRPYALQAKHRWSPIWVGVPPSPKGVSIA